MQQVNPTQEAKALNVRLERDNGEWIAVLPPHPDLKDDEEVGFPAPTEQEALDEARAYRAIEQSKVYKFEYNEKDDVYNVTFNNQTFSGKLLATTYRDAQKAYAEMINLPEPPKAEPAPPPPAPKQRRKRAPNGSQAPDLQIPQAIAPDPQFTSGIGDEPGQLPPARHGGDPWVVLNERITRLEDVMRDAITATAKALEGLNKR